MNWKNFLVNWKTTTAGIALILGAAADVAHQSSEGSFDGNRLQADVAAVIGGFGLIVAKDANTTGGTPSNPATKE